MPGGTTGEAARRRADGAAAPTGARNAGEGERRAHAAAAGAALALRHRAASSSDIAADASMDRRELGRGTMVWLHEGGVRGVWCVEPIKNIKTI